MENKRILRGGHWKRGFHEPAATDRSEGPKGFETCEWRRRRWLPELPRKPKGSEACEARPRPERSGGLPACGARGETNAAPEAKRAGSPSCVARPPGLAKLRNKTRRGFWRWAKEAVGLWSRGGRPQGCRSAGGRQGAGLAPAAWKPKAPGGRNKTRGAGPAPSARGRGRKKR